MHKYISCIVEEDPERKWVLLVYNCNLYEKKKEGNICQGREKAIASVMNLREREIERGGW